MMVGSGWFLTKHRALVTASVQRELVRRTICDSEPACLKLLGRDNTLIEMNRGGLAVIEVESLDARERPGRPAVGADRLTASPSMGA
jgi:hypothetical protein